MDGWMDGWREAGREGGKAPVVKRPMEHHESRQRDRDRGRDRDRETETERQRQRQRQRQPFPDAALPFMVAPVPFPEAVPAFRCHGLAPISFASCSGEAPDHPCTHQRSAANPPAGSHAGATIQECSQPAAPIAAAAYNGGAGVPAV
eukprot:1844569-Rhodomonas_salina.1